MRATPSEAFHQIVTKMVVREYRYGKVCAKHILSDLRLKWIWMVTGPYHGQTLASKSTGRRPVRLGLAQVIPPPRKKLGLGLARHAVRLTLRARLTLDDSLHVL